VIDVTTSVEDATYTDELRQAFERQKRTFDLAMTASQMGTWRYTLADNICVYDRREKGDSSCLSVSPSIEWIAESE